MRLLRAVALFLGPYAVVRAIPATPDGPAPTANILSLIEPLSSSTDTSKCASTITTTNSSPYLAFPNARITHQSSGTIDCPTRLTLQASQTGYRYSVTWISLAGYLKLEPGTYIERFNVSVGYFPGAKQTDVATARDLYGKGATGYDGHFNMSIPVVAGAGGSELGSTACRTSTSDARTGIDVLLFVSLAHEMVEFDDMTPHYGIVGGESADRWLKVGFEGSWDKC
ncbi:hypothetical protein GE09DRAFT_1228928 [Coniochaeta sp. 2T2.1]|nr:hypothetical protein GE09DRAFT_1228928 [Coniochaeta sp. 2T2.1]